MTDPRTPYDANDPFQPPTQPRPAPSEQAPTHPGGAPTAPSAQPPHGEMADEYVITSTAPQGPVPYRNAPDPFGGSGGDGPARGAGRRGSGRRWLIPVAAIVVLVALGAAVYLLLIRKDDGPAAAAGDSGTRSAGSRSAAPSSAPSGSATGTGSAPAGGTSIAGSYEVTGTIESYTGPQTGQLGASAKKAGDPAFKSPQTWTLSGDCVADKPCELTIGGGVTVSLTLDGGTWKGSATESIQCSAVGQPTQATVAVAIPEPGGTATRTLSATCGQQLTEVDTLTLTKK